MDVLDYAIVNTGGSLTSDEGKDLALERIAGEYDFETNGPLDVLFFYNDLVDDGPRKVMSLQVRSVDSKGQVYGEVPLRAEEYASLGGTGNAFLDPNELGVYLDERGVLQSQFEAYSSSDGTKLVVAGFSNRGGILAEGVFDPLTMVMETEELFTKIIEGQMGLAGSLVYSDL
jgi:hypothetical protein